MSNIENKKIHYSQLVWQQLRKNKLAMLGLCSIIFFVLLAIFAPFICFNKPFVFYSITNGLEFPFWKSLFDRNTFESFIDVIFNIILISTPVFILLIV